MICELFKGKERERKRGHFSVLDASHVSICSVFNGVVETSDIEAKGGAMEVWRRKECISEENVTTDGSFVVYDVNH